MKTQQELRVACTKGMQRATFDTNNATSHETVAQPESLKALVERRFKCNTLCNNNATSPSKEAQLSPNKSHQKVARVAAKNSQMENAIEAAEERAAIMEYDGHLPRVEAEKHAIKQHLKPFYFKCTDGGDTFLTSKCDTIEEAKKALKFRFGDKLIKVEQKR